MSSLQNTNKPLDELGGLDDLDELALAAEALDSQTQRYVIAIDATSSMWPYWDMAKSAMMRILRELSTRAACPIEINLIAYRDATCDSVPLEQSYFSNSMTKLEEWASDIRCFGGGDYPESVDLALKQCLDKDLVQVICIADAPGRPETPGFAEAEKLGQKNIPIFGLYCTTQQDLREYWERIAKLSGGKAFHLKDASSMADIIGVILSKNPALAITYQATTIEGKAVQDAL
jgi:hypothetical protein